jgi:hypothetical protein
MQTLIARRDAKFEEQFMIVLDDPTEAIHNPAVLVPTRKKVA